MINGELVRSFLQRHLKITILVAISAGILSYFLISLFPAMNSIDAQAISASWPQMMKDLFGDPVYGFSDIYGWMNLELFHITLWMVFGFFAALLASDVIAKEIEEKAIDILLSTPVSRITIILSRFTGIVVILVTSILPTLLGCILGVFRSGIAVEYDVIATSVTLVVLISLVFAALTIFISVYVPKQTYSVFIAITILCAMFLFEDMAKLVPFIGKYVFISPFHYYRPHEILIYDTFSMSDPFILLGMFVVIIMFSLLSFSNKDILT